MVFFFGLIVCLMWFAVEQKADPIINIVTLCLGLIGKLDTPVAKVKGYGHIV